MIIDPYSWQAVPIQHIEAITDDTLSVRVARPVGYSYRAGQYAVVRVPVGSTLVVRQYSFVSCPDNDFVEFLIQREPAGTVSNWFHQEAATGTTIEISQPFGSFVVDNDQHPLLFVAGRVGVAPFISIIRDELATERNRAISLLYSARGKSQFCYADLLRSVSTTFFDTQHSSRIDSSALAARLTPVTRAYLCGSKQFVDDLTEQLTQLGVPPDRIKRELFTLQ